MKRYLTFVAICIIVCIAVLGETGSWNPPIPQPPPETYGSTDNFRFVVNSREDKTLTVWRFKPECPQDYTMPDTVEIGNEKYTITSLTLGELKWNDIPTYLTLPATLKHIEKTVWDEEVSLPARWKYLGYLNFGKSQIDTIPSYLFANSTIQQITLSPNTKLIEEKAFYIDDLYEINFVEGLEEIADNAFVGGGYFYGPEDKWGRSEEYSEDRHCRIKELNFPKSLKKLGANNFGNCDKLDILILPPSLEIIEKDCFDQCINLDRLVIPNGVKKIEKGAFKCYGYSLDKYSTDYEAKMTSLTLGQNLSEIEENTFGKLPNLKDIYCFNPNPPTFRFNGVNPDATIHVPPGALLNYKNDPEWGSFFKNFVELPEVFVQPSITNSSSRYAKKYSRILKLGESMKLFMSYANFSNKELKEGWNISDPDYIKVVNDVAIPVKEGFFKIKPMLTDSEGNNYISDDYFDIIVRGQIEGYNGVELLPSEDLDEYTDSNFISSLLQVYSLQGIYVGNSIEELPAGIYIIRQGAKSHKIFIK